MSDDVSTRLTAIFDDVAASITPRADFASARAGAATVRVAPAPATSGGGGAPFRRGAMAAAAAAVLCVGGVAAYQRATNDHDTVSTAPVTTLGRDQALPASEPVTTEPTGALERPAIGDEARRVEQTARVGVVSTGATDASIRFTGHATPGQIVRVTSAAGSATAVATDAGAWKAVVELDDVESLRGTTVEFVVTFNGGDPVVLRVEFPAPTPKEPAESEAEEPPPTTEPAIEEPKAEEPAKEEPVQPAKEPEPEPAHVELTAAVGAKYLEISPAKVGVYGTAQPGSKVTATSEYGSAHTVANGDGKWEMVLELYELAPGATAHIKVSGEAHEAVRHLEVTKPGSEASEVAFTANLGSNQLGDLPLWQVVYGTAQPGSVVLVATDYGSADVKVGDKGKYEVKVKMHEVPAGAHVGIRVTNNHSEAVFEFGVQRKAAAAVAFSANAAFTECDSTPPYNEYWGTAAAGSVVKILSPYGNAERTANGDGQWDARVEFPDAPIGETFVVKVKSVATGQVAEFPLTRIPAG